MISLSPADASGYANLGVVYLRKGKNDDAEEMLTKAVEISPDDPDILLGIKLSIFKLSPLLRLLAADRPATPARGVVF